MAKSGGLQRGGRGCAIRKRSPLLDEDHLAGFGKRFAGAKAIDVHAAGETGGVEGRLVKSRPHLLIDECAYLAAPHVVDDELYAGGFRQREAEPGLLAEGQFPEEGSYAAVFSARSATGPTSPVRRECDRDAALLSVSYPN